MNRRGLGKCNRVGVSNAELQREMILRLDAPRPEHDSGAARVMRAAMEKEAHG